MPFFMFNIMLVGLSRLRNADEKSINNSWMGPVTVQGRRLFIKIA